MTMFVKEIKIKVTQVHGAKLNVVFAVVCYFFRSFSIFLILSDVFRTLSTMSNIKDVKLSNILANI